MGSLALNAEDVSIERLGVGGFGGHQVDREFVGGRDLRGDRVGGPPIEYMQLEEWVGSYGGRTSGDDRRDRVGQGARRAR